MFEPQQMYTRAKTEEFDLESGETLYPGLSLGENQLRWGFIRKVYGILSAQIVLTTLVSLITVFYSPINDLLKGNSTLLLVLVFLPFICKFLFLFFVFLPTSNSSQQKLSVSKPFN
ncbi:hypothetical protein ACSQ67_012753 [Phaseolus vulgaris]